MDARAMIVRRVIAAVMIAASLLLEACGAGWHRTDMVTPESPRQQVQVWRGDTSQQWHAVRVTDSTVSGTDFLAPVDCDSCRITVPRATVDSIRLGNPSLAFWKTFGLIILTPVVVLAPVCGFHSSCLGT